MADHQARFIPEGVDPTTPSIARAYDAFLGGKDNFEADRKVLAMANEVVPEIRQMAVENRAWLIRAVRFLTAEAGIDQFLDVGSGLPSAENTHEVAQRINSDAVCVYVDNDPACLAFGQALLAENDRTHLVNADLARPTELMRHPEVRQKIDFERPVGLIHCSTLHHVPEEGGPREIMASYIDQLPSGSYVAFTHFLDEGDGGHYTNIARSLERVAQESGLGSGYFRTRETLERYLDGLELVEPGFSLLRDWWPDGPHVRAEIDPDHMVIGAVGRKP